MRCTSCPTEDGPTGSRSLPPRSTERKRRTSKLNPGAEQRGIEPSEGVEITKICVDSRTNDSPRSDVSAREQVAIGPPDLQVASIEDALAIAIARASAVGRWDIVAQLARELEARRQRAAGMSSPVDEPGRSPGRK